MRKVLLVFFWMWAGLSAVAQTGQLGFSYAQVVSEARVLSAGPYFPEREKVPRFFLELFYDQFRQISFRPEESVWAGTDSPWRLQLLHPGLNYNRIVQLHTVEDGVSRRLGYDARWFDFGNLRVNGRSLPSGYAGFRLCGEVNRPGEWSDFAQFAGATYFRCVPVQTGAAFGVSARGVAVNPGLAEVAEDFPFFKKFWIVRQPAGSSQAVVLALMDSPNVCGAFRFVVTPGRATVTEVEAALFFREAVSRVGLAPFSSMFWYGENAVRKPMDFRPEVHDSDGLLVEARDGRRWWRPLANGSTVRHSSFAVGKIKGFGLRQRDENFSSYQDLEENYHKRPGVWVEPLEGWPDGTVHLLEVPTAESVWDNVACYWQPDTLPGRGETLRLRYRITWAGETGFSSMISRVTDTRVGRVENAPRATRYVVDFAAVPGDNGDSEVPELEARVIGAAQIRRQELRVNPETKGWRAVLEVEPVSVREEYTVQAVLRRAGRDVSENWDYLATPAE